MDGYKIIKLSFLRNKKEVLVKFDNNTTLELPLDIVISFNLNKDSTCSQETYDKIIKQKNLYIVQKIAYKKATSSLKTRYELKKSLLQKGFDEENINIAIEKLENLNIINDEKFAKTAFEYFSTKKNYGINKIIVYLKKNGVSRDIIEKVILDESQNIDQDELILSYYERNIPKIKRKNTNQRIPYCNRMFRNAGFTGETVNKFLRYFKPKILNL